MTTCVYHKKTKTIVSDSRNTDGANARWNMNKIEHLPNGWVFLGSGHCYTIRQCRSWAEKGFGEVDRPDFEYYLEDTDDRDFQCLAISPNGEVVRMIDGEMVWTDVLGDYFAIGSGASYAMGAMKAGVDPVFAVEIACEEDPNTDGPIISYTFEEA